MRGCNLEDSNLAALIVDYFALDDSEASSDEQSSRVTSQGQGKATFSPHWCPEQEQRTSNLLN